jgi:hypothetical protein
MVYFSCDACAEVLKKNQVDSHARRCRACASVSCVDCLVSFYGGTSISDEDIKKQASDDTQSASNGHTKREP